MKKENMLRNVIVLAVAVVSCTAGIVKIAKYFKGKEEKEVAKDFLLQANNNKSFSTEQLVSVVKDSVDKLGYTVFVKTPKGTIGNTARLLYLPCNAEKWRVRMLDENSLIVIPEGVIEEQENEDLIFAE